jgi:hypothetical protein
VDGGTITRIPIAFTGRFRHAALLRLPSLRVIVAYRQSAVMWSQVQTDLERLLAAKVYPLLLSDAVYRHFLMFAGLGPNSLDAGPAPALRPNFEVVAKLRAHIIVSEVEKTGGLDEDCTCAKLLKGPALLCRFWDSAAPKRREGIWWFDSSIIETCKQHAGRSVADRKDWLRSHLAVSIDWSSMNRIDLISLTPAEEVPAIEGKGARRPVYSSSAIPQGKVLSKDYWLSFAKYFPGGVKQTVLPFIPRTTGTDLNSFLARD